MNVLIAEDDSASRTILRAALQAWKYEVTETGDGEEAWEELLRRDLSRILVLDWMMPRMSGLELCRRIRRDRDSDAGRQTGKSPLYVILLTSRGGREDIVEGLKAGADDYIAKPYDNQELRARIQVGSRVVELQSALDHRIAELEEALAHIKTLQGLLPICCFCHKIRTDSESWVRLENYITQHSDAQFSHSVCPECMKLHYPDVGTSTA